ncbi:hypothetical protein ABZ357_13560 [Streptomyces sp. NPDC005917]
MEADRVQVRGTGGNWLLRVDRVRKVWAQFHEKPHPRQNSR